MSQELRISTPGIGALRCRLGTFNARITPDEDGTLPQKARKVVKAWSTNLFTGASFAIDYVDGTAHVCQSWGEIGLLFDLKPPAKAKKPARTLDDHIARVCRMADVVAVVDARAAEPAPLPSPAEQQKQRLRRLRASTPQIKAPPVDGRGYLDAFGVAALPPAVVAAPLAAPSKPAKKAVPAWVAMMRYRAAPRTMARMPKAVLS